MMDIENISREDRVISIKPFSEEDLDKEIFFDLNIKPIFDPFDNCSHVNVVLSVDIYSNGMTGYHGQCLDCGLNGGFEDRKDSAKLTIVRRHKKGVLPDFIKRD
jgi:hypothetical protein